MEVGKFIYNFWLLNFSYIQIDSQMFFEFWKKAEETISSELDIVKDCFLINSSQNMFYMYSYALLTYTFRTFELGNLHGKIAARKKNI